LFYRLCAGVPRYFYKIFMTQGYLAEKKVEKKPLKTQKIQS
jgi:hypothetical protein